ncbi:carbonic anhydrase family protein [Paenibacillus sp. P96]|uniref:carbonic anhydrase n=1 Tax=Paenibacillus zeirhizosphaerae TaxID=2987519 RepID=A0ABT9FRC8_9BACL|nr:carbonic anhydrase family protein [Paenibacillus sp. P96]MDP4097277.1 carbonic anhydrase family protein [Paenibacillus sp. P96]
MINKLQLASTSVLTLIFVAGCAQQQSNQTTSNGIGSQVPSILTSTTSLVPPAHWSYEGDTGPEHWGELEADYLACGNGTQQSPIDIKHAHLTTSEILKPIDIHYGNAKASIQNNGYTIQVSLKDNSNYIVLDGTKFTLTQFHFHHPSEHQINGQNADMELHFVHKSENNRTAVLGILIENGSEHMAFESFWDNLPTDETKKTVELESAIDLTSLLPANLQSIHYSGSLTTPPCTENVSWTVLEHPIEMSQEQIAKFAAIFPDNHRPVQPLGDREIDSVLLKLHTFLSRQKTE